LRPVAGNCCFFIPSIEDAYVNIFDSNLRRQYTLDSVIIYYRLAANSILFVGDLRPVAGQLRAVSVKRT